MNFGNTTSMKTCNNIINNSIFTLRTTTKATINSILLTRLEHCSTRSCSNCQCFLCIYIWHENAIQSRCIFSERYVSLSFHWLILKIPLFSIIRWSWTAVTISSPMCGTISIPFNKHTKSRCRDLHYFTLATVTWWQEQRQMETRV